MNVDPAEWQLLAALSHAFDTRMILHQFGPERDDLMALVSGEPHDARVNEALSIGLYRLSASGGLIEIPAEAMFAALIASGYIAPANTH